MRSHPFLGGALAALLVASPSEAQYDRVEGDTLRYQERTIGTIDMDSPGGPLSVRSSLQATIAIAFGTGDAATAWYESLELEQDGPNGRQRPPTDGLLGVPFELTVDERGRMVTRSAPELPPEIRTVSDLTHQFDDFFISVPQGELRIGLEWADTMLQGSLEGSANTYEANRTRAYRVERDTIVDGVDGLVIRVDQTVDVRAAGEVPGQDLTTETALQGTESGIAVFIPTQGTLHGRERRGELRGTTIVRGPAGEFVIPQVFGYESTLSLRR